MSRRITRKSFKAAGPDTSIETLGPAKIPTCLPASQLMDNGSTITLNVDTETGGGRPLGQSRAR